MRRLIDILDVGALYYLSTWYKKDETSFRTTLFFYGQMFASATSSLISAGLLRLSGTGGLEGWRWIFLGRSLFLPVKKLLANLDLFKQSRVSSPFLLPLFLPSLSLLRQAMVVL